MLDRCFMLLALVLAAAASAGQPVTASELTLEAAMRAASARPQVQAELARARAAHAGSAAQFRGTWLPSLTVDANAARRDQTARIDTPVGGFEIGDEDVWDATIALRQPILDLAEQAYRVPAARRTAAAADHAALRAQRSAAAQAAVRLLDCVSLAARIDAVTALRDSLAQRVDKVQAQADAGRALTADVLDVRVARDRADQQRAQLRAELVAATADLARLTGLQTPVLPVAPTMQPPATLAQPDLESVYAQRQDLLALQARLAARRLEADAVGAEGLPTLGGSVAYLASRGTGIQAEEDTRVGVSLSWTPFTSGRRRASRDAVQAESDALARELADARAGVRTEIARARADFDTAVSLARLAASALDAARSTLDTRAAQFESGRATIDQLLDAQARVAEQEALVHTARYAGLQAWIRFNLARAAPLLAMP